MLPDINSIQNRPQDVVPLQDAQEEGSNGWPIDPTRGTTTAVVMIDFTSMIFVPRVPPVDTVVGAISSLKTNAAVSIIDFPIPYRYPFAEAKEIIDALASVLKSNSNIKTLIVRDLGLEEELYRRRLYVLEILANGQAGTNLNSLWITHCLAQETEVGFLERYKKNNRNLGRLTVTFKTTPRAGSAVLQSFISALPGSHVTQLCLCLCLGKGDLRGLSTRPLGQCSSITYLKINVKSRPAPAEPLPAADVASFFREGLSEMPSLSCLKLQLHSNVELSPLAFETIGDIVAQRRSIQHVGIEILRHPTKLSTDSWKDIGSALGLALSSIKKVSLYWIPKPTLFLVLPQLRGCETLELVCAKDTKFFRIEGLAIARLPLLKAIHVICNSWINSYPERFRDGFLEMMKRSDSITTAVSLDWRGIRLLSSTRTKRCAFVL